MPQPLVSIIIPCFNAEQWLAGTLQSALAQTWPRTEIIVVDDGSSDQSVAVAQSFEAKGVRLLTQINAGAGVARNTGLAVAQGDFIQYLDADDLLSPDKIATQIDWLAPVGSTQGGNMPVGQVSARRSGGAIHLRAGIPRSQRNRFLALGRE